MVLSIAYARLLCDSQDEQIAEHACSSTDGIKRTKYGSEPIRMHAPHALGTVFCCVVFVHLCVFLEPVKQNSLMSV